MTRLVRIIYNDDYRGVESYTHGGVEVALEDVRRTAVEVDSALRAGGYSTELVPLVASEGSGGLKAFIEKVAAGEAVIFNLCEGALGKSRLEMNVAAILELYGLVFTGNPALALAMALDKGLTKDILASRGVKTPAYRVFGAPPAPSEASAGEGLIFPLIVKPLREDASIGIDSGAVVRSMAELRARVETILKAHGQPAIVESFIDGREFNVSVLDSGDGPRVLPPAELTFVDFPAGEPRIVSYEAKWVASSPLYNKTVPVCPAPVDEKMRKGLEEAALAAFTAMGCRDYGRVDMRVGHDGVARVLEVNPNPDLSGDAGLARAAMAAGLDYPALISSIVRAAQKRGVAVEARPKAAAL